MTTTCPVCQCEQIEGLLCHACTSGLEYDLGDVPAIAAELDTTLSRQGRIGQGGRGGLASEKNPIHTGAMQVSADLQNTLTTWVRDLSPGWQPEVDRIEVVRARTAPWIGPFHDHCTHPSCERMRHLLIDPAPPLLQQVSLHLLSNIPEIRRHPAVNELVDEIIDAVRQARRVVDRPMDMQYLGQCMVPTPDEEGRPVTCLEDIYASPTARETRCKVCGVTHEVAERRMALLDQAEDRLFSVQEAATIIGSYGDLRITESTIRNYVSSGQLGYHGKIQGKSVIRMGDLMEVIRQHAAKPKGRKLRRAV